MTQDRRAAMPSGGLCRPAGKVLVALPSAGHRTLVSRLITTVKHAVALPKHGVAVFLGVVLGGHERFRTGSPVILRRPVRSAFRWGTQAGSPTGGSPADAVDGPSSRD